MKSVDSFLPRRGKILKLACTYIILSAFLYVFMEWIFFVTKSSFMDIYNWDEKVKVLLLSGLFLTLSGFLTIPLLFVLDMVFSSFIRSFRKFIYYVPAAFILVCLGLLLVDNFTYTLFQYGIVQTENIMRGLYLAVFAAGFIAILRGLSSASQKTNREKSARYLFLTALVLVTGSLVVAAFTYQPTAGAHTAGSQISAKKNRPNIILFNTDGLNAANMSAYGYERDTTPFLSEFVKVSLTGLNNFSNASASRGSETSTLTGKLPLYTNVLITSNILEGVNTYQHLPGILKRNGYWNVSLGVKSYVDVNAINFQNAFDEVNCAENAASLLSGASFDDEIYFLAALRGRITERLLHITFIKPMENAYSQVTNAMESNISDQERLDCLYGYLDQAVKTGRPLFAHIHLMGTHGPEFEPISEVFSKDVTQDEEWMTDFYDDSILDFDHQVEELVQYLKDHDLYENTILVLYTDHGQRWSTTTRIPLIIHFPGDQHARLIEENTQNADIAPTLLDYLNLQKPKWMTGATLLEPVDPYRLILATRAVRNEDESDNVVTDEAKVPPFYQFGSISAIQCQRVFIFDLQHSTDNSFTVPDYPNPCDESMLADEVAVRQYVRRVLLNAGFNVPDVW